jgi:hypothetical protein
VSYDPLRGAPMMTPEDSGAQLAQIGEAATARLASMCKACGQPIERGSPIARSLRFGWSHSVCLELAEQARRVVAETAPPPTDEQLRELAKIWPPRPDGEA